MNERDKLRLAKRFGFMNPESGALTSGYNCSNNCFPLVWELCEKIENELIKNPEAEKNFLVLEANDKSGGLSLYTQNATEEIENLILGISKPWRKKNEPRT